jgi:hypothetical protein
METPQGAIVFKTVSMANLAGTRSTSIAPEPDRAPTWAELVAVEPRLVDVERRDESIRPRCGG